MRTIKPQKVGVLTRMFEADQRSYLVVTLLVFFPLDAPRALLPEVELWTHAEKLLGKDGILDEGYSKQRGELLVRGSCFPSMTGEAKPVSYVRAKLGSIDKRLAVVGDRVWKRGVPTEPVPFTEMPLDWSRALGGAGFAPNPVGKGAALVMHDGVEVQPLPNLELPGALMRSPKDRPTPAGFGPYDLLWPQRFSKVGTYDAEWLKTRFPGVARDLDPEFFQTAPEDQRIQGYFRGDEDFVLENMHPRRARIEGVLPGVVGRAFVTQRQADGEVFRELSLRLDTVHLYPGIERGLLLFRGMLEVVDDEADDIVHLVVACDDASAPRPASHYEAVLASRLDKRRGAVAALREYELLPPLAEGVRPRIDRSDVGDLVASESLLKQNLERQRDKQRAKAKAYVESQGLVPEDYGIGPLPPEEPVPSPDDPDAIAAFVEKAEEKRAALLADAEEAKKKAEADARAVAARFDVDYDEMMATAAKRGAGPPTYSADQELATLRRMLSEAREQGAPMPSMEATAADPKYEQSLHQNEQRLHDLYARFGHLQPATAELEGDEAARVRAAALAALETATRLPEGGVASGPAPLARRDLTGADLRGVTAQRRDLRGLYLEGANLEGANLEGCDLSGAVLARAQLTGARLAGANLTEANLGGATLKEADLTGARLTKASLHRADLSAAKLCGCDLEGATLLEARVAGADFSGASAPGLTLLQVDASGCSFVGAKLAKARFIETTLAGADFSGAELEKASFVTVKAEGAMFRGARCQSAVFVHGTVLPRADFRGALLDGANLHAADLRETCFEGASLVSACLVRSDFARANLQRARATGALLMRANLTGASLARANLMDALLSKAVLVACDLSDSNLFRADISRTRIDGATRVGGANLKHARVEPRNRDERR
jgi:uncharacterized protein YjbI with pentapeptide repeats